jgi:hypothetical protein
MPVDAAGPRQATQRMRVTSTGSGSWATWMGYVDLNQRPLSYQEVYLTRPGSSRVDVETAGMDGCVWLRDR